MKNIVILGSTGSIGTQTLDIVRENRDKFKVLALAAGKNAALMEEQVREFSPGLAVLYDKEAAKSLETAIADTSTRVLSGMEGIIEAARLAEADTVVGAMVGMIGIEPVMEAIRAGKDIALANKETLVCAGHLIMPLAKEKGVKILPVDSEHSAIFQSLRGGEAGEVEKILLTASGGPFRGRKREELAAMTAAQALKHPNWDMGAKVTIDSSTLANKGLEVMEAHWLFDTDYDNIEVVVHPQSIVHSAVMFRDGAVIAQLGIPDMHLPIQYALTWPERIYLKEKRLDLFELKELTFERPDTKTFRALELALRAARAEGGMPTVFNAANEEAVAAFLKGRTGYLDIVALIEDAMDSVQLNGAKSLEDILETERLTREYVRAKINS
ncbi:MAG: 1-deoxy-D-xylulose-5-phosphate reductoisomerase [Lachnospiraceae bacterium]|nr:1-deoxy-D-xylulose-5-phosphate reductoisomerase [Lachnospiraceae bacterium]